MLAVGRADAIRVAAAAAASTAAFPQAAFATDSTRLMGADAALAGRAGAVLLDTATGSFMPADLEKYLAVALEKRGGATPRVFFAGETHTHELHHALQLSMIRAVDKLDAAPTIIGLEMCWRQHQPALDAFVFDDESRGGGSVETLASRTGWPRTWGYPIDLYTDVLRYARQKQLRLVGLNTPYPVIQAVSRRGLSGLPGELQPYLPDVDLDNREHKRRFAEAIGGTVDARSNAILLPERSKDSAACQESKPPLRPLEVEYMYQAMSLWDEYMASSIAGYVSAQPKERAGVGGSRSTGTERMVVLAGTNHVRGRVGMPDRFTRRTQLPTFTMIPLAVPWPAVGKPPVAATPKLPPSEADWVVYTRPEGKRWRSPDGSHDRAVLPRKLIAEAVFL